MSDIGGEEPPIYLQTYIESHSLKDRRLNHYPVVPKTMEDTVRAYALKDSPNEPRASTHRFQVEVIGMSKGSATGYVAKYISKNIDGHGLESTDGKEAPGTLVQRVAAWSSTWGIRQFQQVGGPPVSLWREFRHAPHLAQTPGLVGQLARAADEAKWAEFVELLGGPRQPRKELQISLAKRDNTTPGRYGEPVGLQTFGVSFNNVVFPTRLETWRIMRKAKTENCTPGRTATRRLPPDGASEHEGMEGLPPWSSVNNCTWTSLQRVGGLESPRNDVPPISDATHISHLGPSEQHAHQPEHPERDGYVRRGVRALALDKQFESVDSLGDARKACCDSDSICDRP